MPNEDFAIIPAPAEGFVELAATAAPPKASGRVFRKQILKYGDLRYKNGQKYKIDEAFADTLIKNFETSGEIVHAPKAGPRNEHTDDPDRNIGEVIAMSKTDKGVYVDIDVRTDDADKMGKTLLGVSGLLALNHENRETGERVGPALLHACITNRPYVTDLEPFQEVLAMSADGADTPDDVIVLTDSEEETMPTKEEAIELLKNEGIDVVALSAEVEQLRPLKAEVETLRPQAEGFVALTSKIKDTFDADTEVLSLSAGTEATVEDFVASVEKAGDKIIALSAEVDSAKEQKRKDDATAEVEKLVLTGYIIPAKKEEYLELRLSNEELFRKFVPDAPTVELSVERGEQEVEIPGGVTYAQEIDRLASLAQNTSAAV